VAPEEDQQARRQRGGPFCGHVRERAQAGFWKASRCVEIAEVAQQRYHRLGAGGDQDRVDQPYRSRGRAFCSAS